MKRLGFLLLLTTAASAAPVEQWRIEMIPGLWPWERRALSAKVHASKDGWAVMEREGVNKEFLRRLRALPPGPWFNERMSHQAVLLSALDHKQRRLFEKVVPAIDAAELALWAHREKLLKELALKYDDPQRLRIHANYDRQIVEMEKRFWRVVLYALDVNQRAAIKPYLPQAHQNPPDVLFHVYQLPGLTPSQASRVQALVQEYVSENAADAAETARLQRELAKSKPAEHARIHEALRVVGDRSGRRLKRVVEAGLEIYTPAQTIASYALVPYITAGDRVQHPGLFLHQMGPTPAQQRRLEPLGKAIAASFAKTDARLKQRVAGMGKSETGEESPQNLKTGMMHQNAAAERIAVMEANARIAILDIMTPDQVAAWVVSPR